jgi:hypothetical protein
VAGVRTIHEDEYPSIAQIPVAVGPVEGGPNRGFLGLLDRGYAECWMRTSENYPSTHSGE